LKFAFRVVVLTMVAVASPDCLAQDTASFADLYRAGKVHEEADRYAEARAEYEKALATEGIAPEQTGQVLVRIGTTYIRQNNLRGGIPILRKVRAMEGILNPTRIEANIVFAQSYLRSPWVLDQSRDAFLEALSIPGIAPEQETTARRGLVKAYMGLRQFSEAREAMKVLASDPNLKPEEKPANRIAIGTTCFLEGKYAEAREELKKALEMEGVSNAQKADIQLKIALSYYEADDDERARPELEKVLTMAGADNPPYRGDGYGNYIPSSARQARLRLLTLKPAEKRADTVAVLFIGGSLTLRGLMPYLVERISASATEERPRIMAGMYTRGGTKIDTFWNDGDTRDTARGMIASMPWDAVVIATFHTTGREDLLKYGELFGDFARSKNIKPVFYECQLPRASPYPETIRKFHEDNVALKETLNIPVAPVALAMTYYLGDEATREEIGTLYADWIHYSPKGMYLVACCLYSAITGYSPVGLYHPENIAPEDATALQEAAWKAVKETNANLKPWK